MPFTGFWVGEGGGTFQGESTTEAQLMTYASQTASTVSNTFSAVNTLNTWLNAWKTASDLTLANISSAISTHDAAVQSLISTHDTRVAGFFGDLNAKLDLYEDRQRQRYEQILAAINNASASIQAYLGQEVDNLEARLAEMRTDIGTITRVLSDTYARCGTINDNLVQHDTNLVGRTQQIYDREAEIQSELARHKLQLDDIQDKAIWECRVKLRQLPQLFSIHTNLILAPWYDICRIKTQGWRSQLLVRTNPYDIEGVTNYDYQIQHDGASPGVQNAFEPGKVYTRLRECDAYGEFKSVTGDLDLYFSEQLPAVLTWPYRIYGDGGNNLF